MGRKEKVLLSMKSETCNILTLQLLFVQHLPINCCCCLFFNNFMHIIIQSVNNRVFFLSNFAQEENSIQLLDEM